MEKNCLSQGQDKWPAQNHPLPSATLDKAPIGRRFISDNASVDSNWKIEKIGVDDEEERVDIEVKYISKKAADPTSEQLSIYDHCPARL